MRRRASERGMAMMWAMLLLAAFSAFSVSVLQRGDLLSGRTSRAALSR